MKSSVSSNNTSAWLTICPIHSTLRFLFRLVCTPLLSNPFSGFALTRLLSPILIQPKILLCKGLLLCLLAFVGCGGGGTLQEISPRVEKSSLANFHASLDKADVGGGVHLSWTQVDRADYFLVYRSLQSNFNLTSQVVEIARTSENTAIDTDVDFGTYYYLVKGCNHKDCFDSDTGAMPVEVTLEKTATTALAQSDSQVSVHWQQVSLAHHYEVLRGTTSVRADAELLVTHYSTTSLLDIQLQPATSYYYWVKSCTFSNKCSPYSEASSAMTLPQAPAPQSLESLSQALPRENRSSLSVGVVPASSLRAPEIIGLESSSKNQQDLLWQAVENASYYEVYRGESADFASSAKIAENLDVQNFLSTNLKPSTFYFYWVKACNNLVCSSPSVPQQARTSPDSQMSILVQSEKNLTMVLEWHKSDEADFYDVYVSDQGDDLAKAHKLISYAQTSYSYRVGKANHEYFYWVRSCDALGCSAFSPSGSAVSFVLRPPQARLKLKQHKLKLAWQQDDNATAYRLEFAQSDNVQHRQPLQLFAEKLSQEENGLLGYWFEARFDYKKDYFFWLSSCNRLGCSNPTKLVFATPDPFKLNDTGVILAAERLGLEQSLANAPCPARDRTSLGDNFWQEDCQLGRDAMAVSGSLKKQGKGFAGFDFSKIDEQGRMLEEDSGSNWSCVKDHHTGLIWQSPQEVNQLPVASREEMEAKNLHALVQKAQQQKLCGQSNWQVPSLLQLTSLALIHASQDTPQIDGHFFPNTQQAQYLTSTFVYSHKEHTALPLVFDFGYKPQSPLVSQASLGASVVIRLVALDEQPRPEIEEEQQYWLQPRFIENQDAIILDRKTSLLWKSCLEVVTKDIAKHLCEGDVLSDSLENTQVNWQQALGLDFSQSATSKHWRLPNLKELLSLMSGEKPEESFPIKLKGRFISTTPFVPQSPDARYSRELPSRIFVVDFDSYTAYSIDQEAGDFSVLLLRNSQGLSLE